MSYVKTARAARFGSFGRALEIVGGLGGLAHFCRVFESFCDADPWRSWRSLAVFMNPCPLLKGTTAMAMTK
jgi:hypothetical protein